MRTKMIFSLRVAGLLTRRGHEIIKRTPNLNKPHLDVFIFELTDEFIEDLDDIMEKIKR